MRQTTDRNKKNVLWLKGLIVSLGVLFCSFPYWIGIFYPQPHQQLVETYSAAHHIDPLLVYALMRRESHYQPQAKSAAGAVGLMQLMPDTANWMAKYAGLGSVADTELQEPEINIQLGCAYLEWLNASFHSQLPVVLAAYNAGQGKVEEWLTAGIWDGEQETLEQIPYTETRKYVAVVMRNYQAYQMIDKVNQMYMVGYHTAFSRIRF